MATIEKRGGSYRITVSAGYNTDGKQIKKRMTWKPSPGMTERQIKKELDKQAVLFEQQVETGQFLDGSITLSEFITKWLEDHAEKQLQEKTVVGYKDMLPRIIKALGHIKLAKLQPHHLIEFYNNLAEDGIREDTKYTATEAFNSAVKRAGYSQISLAKATRLSRSTIGHCCLHRSVSKKSAETTSAALGCKISELFEPVNGSGKLSGSTIVKYHRLLSSILTSAVQWQVIPSNPCNRVKPPHAEYKEAAVLDEKQVAQLIECLQAEPIRYRAAIMLILYTGLRRGELCGLNWDDVDLDKGIIHVTKALLYSPRKGVFEGETKTRQSKRAVTIPGDMIKLLKDYKHDQALAKFALGDQWQDSGKVFTNEYGAPMPPDSLSQWFKRFIKRHDLPNAHIHTLRHVSATLLIAGGADVATVSNRLGHSSKSTTLNIYTHAIKSADAAAAEKLQNILNPKKNYGAM